MMNAFCFLLADVRLEFKLIFLYSSSIQRSHEAEIVIFIHVPETANPGAFSASKISGSPADARPIEQGSEEPSYAATPELPSDASSPDAEILLLAADVKYLPLAPPIL